MRGRRDARLTRLACIGLAEKPYSGHLKRPEAREALGGRPPAPGGDVDELAKLGPLVLGQGGVREHLGNQP